jgi:hypothetical protein
VIGDKLLVKNYSFVASLLYRVSLGWFVEILKGVTIRIFTIEGHDRVGVFANIADKDSL